MKSRDADQLGLFVHTDDRRLPLKDTYTIFEVARYFGVCENTIRKEIAAGELSTVRMADRVVRIRQADLLNYISRRRKDGAADDADAAALDDRPVLEALQRLIAARLSGELTRPWAADELAKRLARAALDRLREHRT